MPALSSVETVSQLVCEGNARTQVSIYFTLADDLDAALGMQLHSPSFALGNGTFTGLEDIYNVATSESNNVSRVTVDDELLQTPVWGT